MIGLSGTCLEFWRQMYMKNNKTSSTILAPVNEEGNSISSGKTEERYCRLCDESHPFGSHTKSRPESRKQAIMEGNGQTWDMEAATCRICNEINEKRNTCGACGKTGKSGDRLHCFSHCLEFILADPDERLQQVRRYDNCTNCLGRYHTTAYHKDTNPGQKPLVCGLYEKASRSYCNSLEHAAFHGSTSHKQNTQPRTTKEKEKHKTHHTRWKKICREA